MIRRTFLKFCLLISLFISTIAYSHPHSFITLKTEFYTEQDKLTKLHFIWTMDELTTSYLKFEYQQNPKSVFNELMINIFENHFFSEFWLKSSPKNKPIILMPLEQDSRIDFNSDKATVSFWARLKNPLTLVGNQFELMTYEKTFYVDMYYAKEGNITINHPNCRITITKPTPDDSTLDYAQSLDQDETPIETDDFILGKLFAQKVVVSCQ